MKQPIPVFSGFVDRETGKLTMLGYERAAMNRWLLALKGKAVDIVIKKHRKDRTNEQNSYYWSVVVPILADHFGHDNVEDMHEDLKLEFNPVESKIEPGKKIGGTTTKMSTEEFMASETSYVERICRWAAMELRNDDGSGIYIPPPKKAEKE